MFETLHINAPFVETLAQIPRYAKFLKELPKNKRKLEEMSFVRLSEECSAIIINKLPTKEKDPWGFIVFCTIGGLVNEKTLAKEEITFKLTNSMQHSMDFDDTYYYMDVVDNLFSDYVYDIFKKDELSQLLEEDHLDEELDEMVEELFHQ